MNQIGVFGASDRWLGILAMPVDEALKSHLRLEERLIVQDVVPESPAAKAGIQRNDILLKLGDTDIHNLQDLIQAVEKSGEAEATLTFLREGKEQTAAVKAEKRSGGGLEIGHIPDLRKELEDKVASWSMQFFGPGAGPHAKFPKDLTVTVTKSGDKPAQVTVQREGKTWDVTEDKLQELPEDVRPHVERLLGRGNMIITAVPPHIVGPQPQIHALPPGVQNRIELRHEMLNKGDIEKLHEELQQLRSDVEALKKQAKPAETEEKPARE